MEIMRQTGRSKTSESRWQEHFIDETYQNPRSCAWIKDPDKIIAVRRGHQVLKSIK